MHSGRNPSEAHYKPSFVFTTLRMVSDFRNPSLAFPGSVKIGVFSLSILTYILQDVHHTQQHIFVSLHGILT